MSPEPTARGLLTDLRRNRWLAPLFGGLPQIPVRDTLPTATTDMLYRMIVIRGGTGVADKCYVCLLDSSGAPGWEVAATG